MDFGFTYFDLLQNPVSEIQNPNEPI